MHNELNPCDLLREAKIKSPDVSIILPTFNRKNLLERAIKSALNQTHSRFELIIVDDCSSDNSQELLNSFNDDRITYVRHTINRGGSVARNTGLLIARGEFISFIDDDDEYTSNRLKTLLHAIRQHPEIDYILSKMIIKRTDHDIVIPKANPMPFTHVDLLLNKVPPLYHTALIKKERIIFFDDNLPRWQDLDFMIRLRKQYLPSYIDEITYVCHAEHDKDRITHKAKAINKCVYLFEKKYLRSLALSKKDRATFYKLAADSILLTGTEKWLGLKYLIRSISIMPMKSNIAILLSLLFGFKGYDFLNRLRNRNLRRH